MRTHACEYMRAEHSSSVYTPQMNQPSHGGWDSVNVPVSPRRDILLDWTKTMNVARLILSQIGGPECEYKKVGRSSIIELTQQQAEGALWALIAAEHPKISRGGRVCPQRI